MAQTTFQNNGQFSETVWNGILAHISPLHLSYMDIMEVVPGYAKVSMRLDEYNTNLYGCAHGGGVYALCDLTSGMAAYAFGVTNVTLQGSINYLKPGKTDYIFAEAKTDHRGKKTVVNRVEVKDSANELIATATFTMYITGEVE